MCGSKSYHASGRERLYILSFSIRFETKYQAKGGDAKAFGGQKYQTLPPEKRNEVFAAILPWLRGQVSQQKRFIATFRMTKRFCVS